MPDPRPVILTQVDEGSYTGAFDPEPLLVVGDLPDPVPDDAGLAAMIEDTGSDTHAALDGLYVDDDGLDAAVEALVEDVASASRLALDVLYDDAAVAALVADVASDTRVALDLVYTAVAVTDTDVEALVENAASATHLALDVLYDFATIAPNIAGYAAGSTQTLKNVTGTLTWVTDA